MHDMIWDSDWKPTLKSNQVENRYIIWLIVYKDKRWDWPMKISAASANDIIPRTIMKKMWYLPNPADSNTCKIYKWRNFMNISVKNNLPITYHDLKSCIISKSNILKVNLINVRTNIVEVISQRSPNIVRASWYSFRVGQFWGSYLDVLHGTLCNLGLQLSSYWCPI